MRTSRAAALACLLAAGCSGGAIDVTLRVPGGDHPLAGADAVAVTLRDSAGLPLAFARSGASADSVRLPHVPGGTGYRVEVEATFGADVLARGRSCGFDVDAGKPPTVPIWFSRIGRFAGTAGPDVARIDGAAFAWSGGALVAGGSSAGTALATTESYDPAAAKFAAGPMLSTPRSGARAVDLGDGSVLLVGGAAKGTPAIEVLSASHSTPEPAGLAPDLIDHAAAAVGDGRVVVAGGRVGGMPTDGAWIITQAGAAVEPLPSLSHARARLTMTSAGDNLFALLFVIGGVDAAGPVAEVETFDPATSSFAPAGVTLATPRSDHTVTRLPSGMLLVVGGTDAAGAPIATAEIIDPVARAARTVARLRTARSVHTATLLPSGRVLVTGGIDAGGATLSSAEIFDPALGAEGDFIPTASLDTPRAGHALVPLCDGTYLVVGGASGAEIYNPL
ncbi:MAG: Kelch repeat-containing protein [Polyangia bacterium]